MIQIGDKTFRNLEEQVLKNQQDIRDLGVINGYDVHVVGTVEEEAELPDPETYVGNYGDAYLVGTETPYDVYIFTRPFEGETIPHWFNAGPLSIPGPQGEQGPQGEVGPQGVRGNRLFAQAGNPSDDGQYIDGDLYINATDGSLFRYYAASEGQTSYFDGVGSVRGPQGLQGIQGLQGVQGIQGLQGEQGPRGDVGGFIHIAGITSSAALLPDPADLHDLTIAYLVGTDPYDLYVQIGEDSESAMWQDVGQLNVATYVTVNGEFQGIWESNVKLDKKTDNGDYVYTHIGASQSHQAFSGSATGNTIALRTNGGQLRVADPVVNGDATNKSYVDNAVSVKLDKVSTADRVYATNGVGAQSVIPYTEIAAGFTIPLRNNNGNFYVGTPQRAGDVANKGYVDTGLAGKQSTVDKVVVISAGSTDTQYPSAKAVEDRVKALDFSWSSPITIVSSSQGLVEPGQVVRPAKETGASGYCSLDIAKPSAIQGHPAICVLNISAFIYKSSESSCNPYIRYNNNNCAGAYSEPTSTTSGALMFTSESSRSNCLSLTAVIPADKNTDRVSPLVGYHSKGTPEVSLYYSSAMWIKLD